MKIELFGTGCAKCDQLETLVKKVADERGVPYELTHIRDIGVLVQRGVSVTPAVAVEGRIVVAGRIPSEAEIASWLQAG